MNRHRRGTLCRPGVGGPTLAQQQPPIRRNQTSRPTITHQPTQRNQIKQPTVTHQPTQRNEIGQPTARQHPTQRHQLGQPTVTHQPMCTQRLTPTPQRSRARQQNLLPRHPNTQRPDPLQQPTLIPRQPLTPQVRQPTRAGHHRAHDLFAALAAPCALALCLLAPAVAGYAGPAAPVGAAGGGSALYARPVLALSRLAPMAPDPSRPNASPTATEPIRRTKSLPAGSAAPAGPGASAAPAGPELSTARVRPEISGTPVAGKTSDDPADPNTLTAPNQAEISGAQVASDPSAALARPEPSTTRVGREASDGEQLQPVSRFTWPLSPRPPVSRPFQPPSHPYGPGHRGVDLVGAAAQPVLAAGDGVVVYAGPLADRGVISIDHADGLRTSYEPVRTSVRSGQVVRRGEPIGTLETGHLGCPAAACLHWGLRRDGRYLDPLLLVRTTHVRLLPWPDGPAA